MKKYLLILLMLILPAQYTWSAAAVYCQHEQNAAYHFGHHAHHHKATSEEGAHHGKVTTLDNDCEYCHLFYHAFLVPFDTHPAAQPALTYTAPGTLSYTSHIPRRPPRPNWFPVA